MSRLGRSEEKEGREGGVKRGGKERGERRKRGGGKE